MDNLALISSQFHFLRPLWLLALIPAVTLVILLWRKKTQSQQWQQLISPELLPFLLDGTGARIKPWHLSIILFGWLLATLALAGPSWEKRPVQVEKNQQALVIILDLSPSMLTEDIKPSRLIRARLKIADILHMRKDGQTALVVYAGDAHVVTPLTDDVDTINNLLPITSPYVMPLQGSNTEAAVSRSLQLLKDAGIVQGDLLLITDGVDQGAQDTISHLLSQEPNYRLSVLGVGGKSPAPIPSGKGGFIRDNHNNIVTTQLNSGELQRFAQFNRGRYASLSDTARDLSYLLAASNVSENETQAIDRNFDQWFDQGYWLIYLLLPIIIYCFRRGVLLSLLLVPLIGLSPSKSYAFSWNDLWQNENQQAQAHLRSGENKIAAEQFKDPTWKAAAQYHNGDYAEAAKNFALEDSAEAHFNRGNALAKGNKLKESLKAYDESLKRDPNFEDAKKNRQLVEELIKQQEQQQQQSDKQQDSKDKNNENDKSDSQNKKDQSTSEDSSSQQQSDQKNNQQQNGEKGQNQEPQNDASNKDQQNDPSQTSDKNTIPQEQNSQNQNSKAGERELTPDEQKKAEEDLAKAQAKEAEQQQAEEAEANQPETNTTEKSKSEEQKSTEQKKYEEMIMNQPSQDDGLSDEERQAVEQWLRRVPDEPSEFLKNKFRYQHYQQRQQKMNGDWQGPENDADKRW